MAKKTYQSLGPRERQIMDVIYRRGKAMVRDVLAEIPNPPSRSAIRAMLRILEEEKGLLAHEEVGLCYVYRPVVPRSRVRRSALRHVVETFFSGSVELTIAGLLDMSEADVSEEELDRVSDMVEEAKKKGRG